MYIYRLYDENKEIIYVGKTKNSFKNRIWAHFTNALKAKSLKYLWRKDVVCFDHAKVKNQYELDLYELFYINKLMPKNNSANKYNCEVTIELPGLIFSDLKSVQELGIDLKTYQFKFEERERQIKRNKKTVNIKQKRKLINEIQVNYNSQIEEITLNIIKHSAPSKWYNLRNLLMSKFILYAGLKTNEIINLDFKNVNVEKQVVILENRQHKEIPLHPEIIKTYLNFSQLTSKDGALFKSNQNKRISARAIQKIFKKHTNNKKSPNDFRRIFKKEIMSMSDDINCLSEILSISVQRVKNEMNKYYFENGVN